MRAIFSPQLTHFHATTQPPYPLLQGYGGSQAFDNDDGSAFFHTHHNVFWDSDGFKVSFDANHPAHQKPTTPQNKP